MFFSKFPPSTVRLKRECCTLPRLIQWVVSPKNYCDLFVWRRLHKTKCSPGAYSRCFFQIPAYLTSKPWCTVTSWSTLWKKPGRFYLNDFGLHYVSETVSPKTPGTEPHSKKSHVFLTTISKRLVSLFNLDKHHRSDKFPDLNQMRFKIRFKDYFGRQMVWMYTKIIMFPTLAMGILWRSANKCQRRKTPFLTKCVFFPPKKRWIPPDHQSSALPTRVGNGPVLRLHGGPFPGKDGDTHRINGSYIYLHEWLILFMVNLGKYTNYGSYGMYGQCQANV